MFPPKSWLCSWGKKRWVGPRKGQVFDFGIWLSRTKILNPRRVSLFSFFLKRERLAASRMHDHPCSSRVGKEGVLVCNDQNDKGDGMVTDAHGLFRFQPNDLKIIDPIQEVELLKSVPQPPPPEGNPGLSPFQLFLPDEKSFSPYSCLSQEKFCSSGWILVSYLHTSLLINWNKKDLKDGPEGLVPSLFLASTLSTHSNRYLLQPRLPGFSSTWFPDLEARLNDTPSQVSSNICSNSLAAEEFQSKMKQGSFQKVFLLQNAKKK